MFSTNGTHANIDVNDSATPSGTDFDHFGWPSDDLRTSLRVSFAASSLFRDRFWYTSCLEHVNSVPSVPQEAPPPK